VEDAACAVSVNTSGGILCAADAPPRSRGAAASRVKLPEEVPVSIRKRGVVLWLLLLGAASPSLAQQFAVGASYGWFNDVEDGFHLDDFHSPAWEGWVQAKLGDEIVLRLTYGHMRVLGDNVGKVITPPPGSPVPPGSLVMPPYRDRLQFVSLDVSYLLTQGPLVTGIFAGVGGYGIRPEEVSPDLDPFRDQRERVVGLQFGVDGDLHIYRGFSLVGRATYHAIFSEGKRSLLVTSVGTAFKF
jgi:hypothetical protein